MVMLLKDYARLLHQLTDTGWRLCGVADFLRQPSEQSVLLRHDVDRRPRKAVAMALLEHSMGIRSTYYFRSDRKGGFPDQAMTRISGLGHEAGYHYETLAECGGDRKKALTLFERNLRRLRQIVPSETVSMHGRPLSRYNNQDLLRDIDLTRYGLLGDAVLHVSVYRPLYFTDVGGRWNHPSANLRDSVPGARLTQSVGDALQDPARLLKNDPGPVYISTHPERWADGVLDMLFCAGMDVAANGAKQILRRIRKNPA